MSPALWWGVLIGVITTITAEVFGGLVVITFLKGADMAEERAWTGDGHLTWTEDDDNELLRLARDANGEA